MQYMDLQIDKSKLMTMTEVVDYLETYGANYSVFSELRDRYEEEFGNSLVWNYQSCADYFPGFFLMPVQEGILGVPYNEVEADAFEVIVTDGIALLSAEDLRERLTAYRSFAEGLMNAMEDMIIFARMCNPQ